MTTPNADTLRNVEKKYGSRIRTPFILLDEKKVERNYRTVAKAFGPRMKIFFAVKANNHPLVLHTIEKLGGDFDVASAGELLQLCRMGVAGQRIAFSNPVKIPDDVRYAYEHGCRLFSVDTLEETDKVAKLAPGSEFYVRLAVDDAGSGWPLSGKFGADAALAVKILSRGKAKGLVPAGLTFHVGSQCVNVGNWTHAIADCGRVWHEARARGIRLDLIDIGGGLPAPYRSDVPSVAAIAKAAWKALDRHLPGAKRFMIEPGRFLVADAAVFVATVIGKAVRGGETKVHLDASIFSGLMEAYEKFWYPVECLTEGARKGKETVTLVGPTCDSVDTIAKDISLPRLAIGDRVVFGCAGAYTNSYEDYNGFGFPDVHSAAGLVGTP